MFEDQALANELGIAPTREVHALAVGTRGHGRTCGFSSCLLGQKACLEDETRGYRGGGAIGGTKHGGDTG